MKNKNRVFIIMLTMIFILVNNYTVKAKINSNYNDNTWGVFNSDSTYVYDWGLGVIYSDSNTSMTKSTPPTWIDKSIRRFHDLGDTNYLKRVPKFTKTDKRGWVYHSAEWYNPSTFYSKYNLYSEYDKDKYNIFSTYNIASNYETATNPQFTPDGYNQTINGNGYKHRRFYIVTFKKEKPKPVHYKNFISTSGNTYSSGNTLWAKTNTDISVKTLGLDKYKTDYGQNAQYEAQLKENFLKIRTSNNSVLINKEFDLRDNKVITHSNTGGSIVKSASTYWVGNTDGNRKKYDGLYLNGFASQITINSPTELDLIIESRHRNKYNVWDSSTQNNKFSTSETGSENYSYLKLDGTKPTATISPNSTGWVKDLTLNYKISDSRSGVKYWKVRYEKDGVWSDWSGERTGLDYTAKLSAKGKRRVQIYVKDNVGNENYITSDYYYIDGVNPVSSSGYVSGARYIDGNNYWVKPGDTINFWTQLHDTKDADITYIHSHRVEDEYEFYKGYKDDNTQWNVGESSVAEWIDATSLINNTTTLKVKFPLKIQSNSPDYTYILKSAGYDKAHNWVGWNNTGMNVKVDGTNPTLTFIINPSAPTTDKVTITALANDIGSGIKNITKAGGSTLNTTFYTFDATSNGTHTFTVVDNVGNVTTENITISNIYASNTKPIANFTVSSPVLVNQTLSYTDTSSPGDSWDSISTREWSWSKDGVNWTNGQPTKFDLAGISLSSNSHSYKIRLRVKDNGNTASPGQWSDYCIKDVVVYRINTKPIANFTVSSPVYINQTLSYTDTSSPGDSWDSISTREWSWSKDGVNWTNGQPTKFDLAGTYKIRLRVKDNGNSLSPGQWSDYCIKDVVVVDLSVDGMVLHTDLWNEKRINYNMKISGEENNPRAENLFYPGENFILNAITNPGANAISVFVKIKDTPFSTYLTQTSLDFWQGELWNESFLSQYNGQTLTFKFTAIYTYGTVTKEVIVEISEKNYWQQHNIF